jgi:hypothetical protein
VEGLIYELPEERQGTPLATSFDETLAALAEDRVIVEAMGEELVETFKVINGAEWSASAPGSRTGSSPSTRRGCDGEMAGCRARGVAGTKTFALLAISF